MRPGKPWSIIFDHVTPSELDHTSPSRLPSCPSPPKTHSLSAKTALACPRLGGNALALARVQVAPSLDDQTSPIAPIPLPAMTHSLPAKASTVCSRLAPNGAAGVASVQVAPSADDQTSPVWTNWPPTIHSLSLKTAMPWLTREGKAALSVTRSHDRPSAERQTSLLCTDSDDSPPTRESLLFRVRTVCNHRPGIAEPAACTHPLASAGPPPSAAPPVPPPRVPARGSAEQPAPLPSATSRTRCGIRDPRRTNVISTTLAEIAVLASQYYLKTIVRNFRTVAARREPPYFGFAALARWFAGRMHR